MNKLFNLSLFLIILASLFSCSLKYNETQTSSSTTPEFVFNSPQFIRVTNGQKTITIDAEQIEQYEHDETLYAKALVFKLFDETNKIKTSGTCNLLSANSETGIYTLFDDIKINSDEKDITITAQNLKWNDKTEQLVSAGDAPVTITQKDGTKISGNNFSASGFDNSFSFSNNVSGELIYEDK